MTRSRFLLLFAFFLLLLPSGAAADHTPGPSSVAIAGSLQSEVGGPGDWQPECATTDLSFDAEDERIGSH